MLDRVHAHRAFADRGGALDRFQVFDRASIVGSSCKSLRLNLMPESAGAGCNLSVTFSPVCSDVPLTAADLAKVICGSEIEGMVA